MTQSLLVIDGNSILNRAFYGLAGRTDMKAPDGTPTGAIYAFLNIYYRFTEEINPDLTCVCFDLKAPTFRHKVYKEYKAKRKGMPDDLASQVPVLKNILDGLGIARIELEGYEADDLIGSISKQAAEKKLKTYILTGDKDDLQLIDENISVIMPVTNKGKTSTHFYDNEKVMDKYGITPGQFVDFKAIMGDPSDNIPGVKGIGEKGALKLLTEYGSLDNIYKSIDSIPDNSRKKLLESKEMAFKSRFLSEIKCDIPADSYFDKINTAEPDNDKLYEIFTRLGFKSFLSKLNIEVPESVAMEKNNKSEIISNKIIKKITVSDLIDNIDISKLKKFDFPDISGVKDLKSKSDYNKFILDSAGIESKYLTEHLKNIIGYDDKAYVVAYILNDDSFLLDCNMDYFFQVSFKDFEPFVQFLSDEKIRLVCNDIKDVISKTGIDSMELQVFDIFVAAYLLGQSEGKPSLERIAMACGVEIPLSKNQEENNHKQQSLFDSEEKDSDDLAIEEAKFNIYTMDKIAGAQFQILVERGLFLLAFNVEMPLALILGEMEHAGVMVDIQVLNDFKKSLKSKIEASEKKIYEYAGEEFNINSPKQLGDILFNKLKLPKGKKGKSGYSTNSDVLEMLKPKHPVIEDIITYRQLTKLNSTFVQGLSNAVSKYDNRVHTTFQQMLTSTGRLSSSNPNLQNIPIKLDIGREIRKAFVAADDHVLIDADYSQIELRLLADFSGDENMIESFINDEDIHTNTAVKIFDTDKNNITPGMRSAAKTINFSIVYGIGEFSLASDLGISMKEAGRYISEYHKKYPAVKPYFENIVAGAYKKGYVETLFRRRRYIKELSSANKNLSSFGERAAMNTPLQGTAADIIKIAMIITHRKLKSENCNARLILQVHDELILESHRDDASRACEILSDSMENAIKLAVPLVSKAQIKNSWYDN